MKPIYAIIIVIVLIVAGFYFYKLIPFHYTPNIPPLLSISKGELNVINAELKKENLTEEQKEKLINRRKEIYKLISKFVGKDIE